MTIDKTFKNLRKNGIEPYLVETREEVLPLLERIVPKKAAVAVGGSMTLFECGVIDFLRGGDFNFYDRYAEGFTREEIENVYRQSYRCDVYFCSTNAVTQNGELYNVDGNSNRVSAIAYGPKQVILVAGINKLVKDLDEAVYRVKTIAAPLNTKRLGSKTYCKEKGECTSLTLESHGMTDGCKSEGRICCNYLISTKQRINGRIKFILVNEPLGY